MVSQEYISAVVILIVSILKIFNIEIANDVISGLVVGVLALWVAIRRYSKGDINIMGAKSA